MADTKISALTASTGLALADLVPVVDDVAGTPATQKATLEQVRALLAVVPINAQTGTTYTLALTDLGKLVTCTNASAVTLTVPPNSSVAFPVGSMINVAAGGTGVVTVAAGAGVTVNRPAAFTLALAERYAQATLVKAATDEWWLAGHLAGA